MMKLVAGTDLRDGVEVEITVNAFGNDELERYVKETLLNGGDFDRWGIDFDFVHEVESFDVEDGDYIRKETKQ